MIGFFPTSSWCGMPVFQNDPAPGSLFLMFLGDSGHHQTVTKPFCFKVEISVHGGAWHSPGGSVLPWFRKMSGSMGGTAFSSVSRADDLAVCTSDARVLERDGN